jgi:hypothetical protein
MFNVGRSFALAVMCTQPGGTSLARPEKPEVTRGLRSYTEG